MTERCELAHRESGGFPDVAALAPFPVDHPTATAAHVVQLYEHDAFLVETVARFVGGGLGSGDAALIIATEPHRDAIDRRLVEHGLDVVAARRSGRYVTLDAARTLDSFMRDEWPDAERFGASVGEMVSRAADGGRRGVRAFGEMVSLLWSAGNRDAAVRLEQLWNELAGRVTFSLLCGYPIAGFGHDTDTARLTSICSEHSEVIPAESYTGLTGSDARLRRVAELQQKARALETEIAYRKQVEDALRDRNQTLQALNEDNARLYEAERRLRDESEAANRAKDEFLAMLGHELRNPLSAVRNAVVAARLDPARHDRALEIASRGADQLARLVDDLLDVARITHGRITLRKHRLPFVAVVERAIETARPSIDERGHTLTAALGGADLHVDGDATRLEQVVVNLLTNAAKYTEPGGRIAVTAAREGDQVTLRVRDTGIGLSADMLPRVFDLFTQDDRGLDRAQGGLGVGLTIVKRLVELHGGRVEAHSAGRGAGAEFVVRLPAVATSVVTALARPRAKRVRAQQARILLVEDNVDAADGLRELLEVYGHRVRVASDGPHALAMATADPPDVMLVDIGLPGMDGYEVARRVRADAQLRRVLLIALTGYGRVEDRADALGAGFDRHLVKPVTPSMIQDLVAELAGLAVRPDAACS